MTRLKYYEFFAGGGMARAGLGDKNWRCIFANDFDRKKGEIYRANWGDDVLSVADVRSLQITDLPEQADLVWASFPCQDLSLAGGGAGLRGDRSGTFWPFWNLIRSLVAVGRQPSVVVLENVLGTLTSHQGRDFTSIAEAFLNTGYLFGALVIDASLFVPQSRPRLFMIGVHKDYNSPNIPIKSEPNSLWHTSQMRQAVARLPSNTRDNWVWWHLPNPCVSPISLSALIDDQPSDVSYHTAEETEQLLRLMSDIHQNKVEQAKASGSRVVGTIYKRTRVNTDGVKVQRAEVRFDNVAGCLRTPSGGSSRQIVVLINGQTVRTRLISSRETARLMGLPDTYILPAKYNEAYHLTGDGVAVPVVRYLAEHLLEPLLSKLAVS